MAGAVATDPTWADRLRSVRAVTGGILHPLAAYQAHRGLQTLPVRVRAQQQGAQSVARWLSTHDRVRAVFYPGLGDSDPRGLVGRQQSGPGAVLAVDVGSYPAAAAVTQGMRLITHAVSLGGVDSLIQHPASLTHRPVDRAARPGAGLVRVPGSCDCRSGSRTRPTWSATWARRCATSLESGRTWSPELSG